MKKNFIYNVIYQMLILILPLITVPYVSRRLGADGIGIYSYTYSIAYYFMLIAMLGLNNYGNRTIAKVRDDKKKLSKEFCSIYSMQLITSISMVVLYYIYICVFDNKYKMIAIIQSIYVISTIFDINWFYFGIEKFKLTITRNSIIKILSLIFIFIFVKDNNDLWKYVLILSGSMLISNVIIFSFLPKYVKKEKIGFKDVVKHFKPCFILFLPVIAVSIYKIMDKIMLGIMTSVEEVGYYENAEKIIQVPLAIITAMGTVMLPKASNMISNNKEKELKNLISKTMPFIMFLAFPMTIGVFAISKDFSLLFFGEEFRKSGILMQFLAVTIIFLSWGNVIRTQYLIPKERDKEYVISAFIGAIVNFIINLILIPNLSSIGATIGTIVAEFFVMFYQSWAVRKELNLREYIKGSSRFLVTSIIMFFIVIYIGKFINNITIKLTIQIIVAIIIYGILNIKYILSNINFIPKLRRSEVYK